MKEYEVKKIIGEGSFGKVYLVKKLETGKVYAMKVLEKSEIIDPKQKAHMQAERNIMS